ncbi:hypothetical protein FOXYSP1_19570 [Fusarium oxysporum f. sp. phaseoli]
MIRSKPVASQVPPGRMAQTPSSPLNPATTTAATEGAARSNPSSIFEQRPVSIIELANDLARERVEEHNAKLMVFQAFCAKFEEAAQQFTTGLPRRLAQQFADSFLDSWKREALQRRTCAQADVRQRSCRLAVCCPWPSGPPTTTTPTNLMGLCIAGLMKDPFSQT